jgi:pyruvate/2-oxoglutarate dehydrogenase complex dihydrolipoamide dehydrogenase (E3) component
VFSGEGIDVVTGVGATEVRHHDGFTVNLADGRTLTAEQLLVATGRRVDLAAIGTETIGVDPSSRSLAVDEHLRVTDGVWAVGDVTGQGAFTHVAMYQARIAAADILGEPHTPADYSALPRVTFTDPEVGSVGLTVERAREAGLDVGVASAAVPSTARGWLHAAGNEGFIQLVADRDRGVLVGATAMGPTGGEVLGLLALAVHARVPIEELRSMIYAYPTFHRGIEDALRSLE